MRSRARNGSIQFTVYVDVSDAVRLAHMATTRNITDSMLLRSLINLGLQALGKPTLLTIARPGRPNKRKP